MIFNAIDKDNMSRTYYAPDWETAERIAEKNGYRQLGLLVAEVGQHSSRVDFPVIEGGA